MKAIAIGGMPDHVHILLSLPATSSVAKTIQLLKGGSSKWVHDTFPEQAGFQWQEGYGAFSVGTSQVPQTIEYIQSQQQHHQKRTFEQEFLAFLQRHKIDYDTRYVWG